MVYRTPPSSELGNATGSPALADYQAMPDARFVAVLRAVAGAFPVMLGGAAIELGSGLAFAIALGLAVLYVPAALLLGD